MRIQSFTLAIFIGLITISALVFSRVNDPAARAFSLETMTGQDKAKLSKPQLAADAAQWRLDRLKDENGFFSPAYVANALAQADNFKSVSRSVGLNLQWQELGPDNVGGRTRAILIDKRDTTNQTIYAGGVTGGMWKSTDGAVTWHRLTAWNQWVGIACITQAPAPDYSIYIGTGAGLDYNGYSTWGSSSYASGGYGNGIFKLNLVDSPVLITPNIFNGTLYDPTSNSSPWFEVNRIAVNPAQPNQIIAGTMLGLYESNDNGSTWGAVSLPTTLNGFRNMVVDDVKWSKDGKNIFASLGQNLSGGNILYSNDGGTTWAQVLSSTNSGYPVSGMGRIELAVAPSDPKVVYALMALSTTYGTKGLYKSVDAGKTWTTCVVGGPLFQLFEEGAGAQPQGWYDNAIAVSPADADKVYMGGVNFYTYSSADGLTPADVGYSNESNPHYMHPDKHTIVIADNNPDLMFIGCDGGIFKSIDAFSNFQTPTYTSRNNGYNVTQNYGIGAGLAGDVIGGAQDNGTNYINYYGSSFGAGTQVLGGDGIVNAVSQINPDIWFGGIYFAALYRSSDHTNTWGGMFDVKIDPAGQGGASVCGGTDVSGDAQFITPFYLSETSNAVNGFKTVTFVAGQNYSPGQSTKITSQTGNAQFEVTLTDSLSAGSSLMVADPFRSRLIMSTNCGVFLTSDALNGAIIPRWFKLTTSMNGLAESFVASGDADKIYVGTNQGNVYKFTGVNAHADTATYPAGTSVGVLYPANSLDMSIVSVAPGRSIEGLAVDPNDNTHLVATVAGFSTNANQPHVYESHDAGTTWSGLIAGLPNMPVYSVVIHDVNTIIIGTEFGVWAWNGSTWTEENGGFERVPVYRMIERPLYQNGCNVLYLGSHGRGMWRCTTLTSGGCQTNVGTGVNNVKPNAINGLNIYPNPVQTTGKVSLNIDNSAKVTLRVFDMTGKLHSEISYQNVPAGTNLFDLNASELSSGTYLLAATLADERTISKLFVVAK